MNFPSFSLAAHSAFADSSRAFSHGIWIPCAFLYFALNYWPETYFRVVVDVEGGQLLTPLRLGLAYLVPFLKLDALSALSRYPLESRLTHRPPIPAAAALFL